MNIDAAFPSKYLKAADLGDSDRTVTIAKIDIEDIGKGKEQELKPVLYFNETKKGLVLNKTNSKTIKSLHGPETDAWVGKQITLFTTEVDFAGDQILAIRVRLRVSKQAATFAPPPADNSPAMTNAEADAFIAAKDAEKLAAQRASMWNEA